MLRELNAPEWNMERLNRRSNGAGRVYHAALVRGPLSMARLREALHVLQRCHPLLRARVVRLGDSHDASLAFVESRHVVPLREVLVQDPGRDWPAAVEADMNLGPSPSWTGAFRAMCIEPVGAGPGELAERVLVLGGPHSCCDATSLASLMTEWLRGLAGEDLGPSRALVSSTSPFTIEVDGGALAEVEDLRRALGSWRRERGAFREAELERLHAKALRLEDRLLALSDGPARPRALLEVQSWLDRLSGWSERLAFVAPEERVPVGDERAEHVGTGLLVRSLDEGSSARLFAACARRGLTVHASLGAASHRAFMARQREQEAGSRDAVRAGTPVDMRPYLTPSRSPGDLCLAAEVILTTTPVRESDSFWDVARAFGGAVTERVRRGRHLAAWHRAARRDRRRAAGGMPLLLVSNTGRSRSAERYGELEVLRLQSAMATHGMFQINLLCTTFRGRLGACFYYERPTVSRASMQRFADHAFYELAHCSTHAV
ncbi:MAG: hypothetical protein JRI25_01710 [Deltaproteobacteria bacterium]|nr:hypothetical protein [Deltaproteobacteria bacterium]